MSPLHARHATGRAGRKSQAKNIETGDTHATVTGENTAHSGICAKLQRSATAAHTKNGLFFTAGFFCPCDACVIRCVSQPFSAIGGGETYTGARTYRRSRGEGGGVEEYAPELRKTREQQEQSAEEMGA